MTTYLCRAGNEPSDVASDVTADSPGRAATQYAEMYDAADGGGYSGSLAVHVWDGESWTHYTVTAQVVRNAVIDDAST